MKGLLIKDFKLMAVQKNFFAVILIMCILFLAAYEDPTFMISYMVMMVSFFSISTISYDEYDNGGAFLFTLPITRKGYVTEKYLFGFLNMLLAMVVISFPTYLSLLLRHMTFSPEEFAMTLVGSCVAVILILSIMIPLQLKFGAEKSRVALMIMILAIFLSGYLVMKGRKGQVTLILSSIVNYADANPAIFVVVLCLILAALVLVSYTFSVKIMQKKEY